MRVTRLEIFGFKSFMDRLVLPLENGITGVVGPNGCGKSNVVDAIRWILGETRASSLRGGVLEDIIFNGTDKLRPLGLAEVTMTVRASGANLLADIQSPLVDLDAVLQEALNEIDSSPATAPEERADAGTEEPKAEADETSEDERPKLTVISGGLDSNTPGEVPEKQEPAEPDVSHEEVAQLALKQFPWLQQATEVQITRRLYRSGDSEFFINRIPCRLKDIKDFFRAVGIAARGYTLVAQGEVSRIVTSRPQERRLIFEEAAGILGFRDKIAAAQRRLADTEVNVSRINDIIKEVDRQVSVLKRQADRARNRQALKDQVQQREMALFSDSFSSFSSRRDVIDERRQKAQAEQSRCDSALHACLARETSARGELMQVDIEGDTIRAKMDAHKEELHNRSRQRADSRSRINELRAFAEGKRTEIQRLEERCTTLRQRKEDSLREIARLEAEEAEISDKLKTTEGADKEELQRLGAELQALRNDLRGKENEIRSVRDQLISRQSSLESIQEQLISASPLSRLEETARTRNTGPLSDEHKMLIEGIVIPAALSKAVQAVLAERAAYIVTDSPHDVGAAFSRRVREVDPNNKKGLGLGAYMLGRRESRIAEGMPFRSLLKEIVVEENFEHALVPLLEQCFIAETMDEAVRFFAESEASGRELPRGCTLVTLEGDILTKDSYFSFRHQGGLVQLSLRVAELEGAIEQISSKQSDLEKGRDALQEEIVVAEARHKEALAEAERRHALIRDLSGRQGSIRGKLQAEVKIGAQIEGDVERAANQIKEALARIEEYAREEDIVAKQLAAIATVEDEEIRKELDALTLSYSGIDRARKEGRLVLDQVSKEVQGAREALDQIRAEASQIDLDSQRLCLEYEALQERVMNEYGPETLQDIFGKTTSAAKLDDETRQKYQEEVRRLKERMVREGDVDPESVDRYEAEKERLIDLKAQRDDLEKAGATLRKTITKLTDTAEKRFISTFRAVEKNFSKLVPQLFGGGKGSVELTDASKPLDSGIEITMRPPGKKPKSIDLLSGGEKALTAVALIFAMFLERPSPLCVLDEVDAPLDEANLIRFLSMVKEMSTRTQFVMITHNKQSMAVSDNLVGVTMQEPGSSKVISVTLQEAYSQVA